MLKSSVIQNPIMKIAGTLISWVLFAHVSMGMAQEKKPLQVIPHLDVQRYLGRWYEIAKFPNRFQQQCVSDTSADYALLEDGSIRVLNQCRNAQGEWERAVGQARQIGGPQSSRLTVRFAPAWLSFLPFVWGDYWVIDLDESYQLVAVSEPKREYLWILSRSPDVDSAKYAALVARLASKGMDVQKLTPGPQSLAISKL